MPTQTEADAVVVLNENSLVPNNYLDIVNAVFYLNSTASIITGSTFKYSNINVDLDLIKEYKNYLDPYANTVRSCVTAISYFNTLYGCIFNGYHYNKCGGYKPTISPRYVIDTPYEFIRKMYKSGDIIYQKQLQVGYFLTKEEQTNENIFRYFYEIGCKDHLYETTSIQLNDTSSLMYNIGKLEMKLGIRC